MEQYRIIFVFLYQLFLPVQTNGIGMRVSYSCKNWLYFTWLDSICIRLSQFALTTSRNPFRSIGKNVDWMDDKNLSIVVWLQDLCKDGYDPCSYLESTHLIWLVAI